MKDGNSKANEYQMKQIIGKKNEIRKLVLKGYLISSVNGQLFLNNITGFSLCSHPNATQPFPF